VARRGWAPVRASALPRFGVLASARRVPRDATAPGERPSLPDRFRGRRPPPSPPEAAIDTPPRAVLVGVLVPGRAPEELDASLDELGRLCDTLGIEPVGRVTQRRPSTKSAKLLGDGRLKELAKWTGGTGEVHRGPQGKGKGDEEEDEGEDGPEEEAEEGAEDPDERPRADVVVVDHELSPSQLRNLKAATGAEVLDRNGVIIEIFHTRAKSVEAKLQVELARLQYLAPRLRELGGPSERQRGGVGGKGAGETSLELGRREVRDRIAEVRREIKALEGSRGVRREARSQVRQVALVGYTNAGKSSLMRGLTGAEPYVADQLFATLDTTVRRLSPAVIPPILATDTVGFIKDLPHSLVASFRSTLDAALEAGLLLHVVDASDPTWPEQEEVTRRVLAEIGGDALPRVLVFNKCDRLSPGQEEALMQQRPDAWCTAAHDPERLAELHRRIVQRFAEADPEFELFVPWTRAAAMGAVHREATVVSESFEEGGARYVLRGSEDVERRLRAAVGEG
jgi:GTP-binding protein HflX